MQFIERAKHYLVSINTENEDVYLTKLGDVDMSVGYPMSYRELGALSCKLEAEIINTRKIELKTCEITDEDVQKILEQL